MTNQQVFKYMLRGSAVFSAKLMPQLFAVPAAWFKGDHKGAAAYFQRAAQFVFMDRGGVGAVHRMFNLLRPAT